MSTETETVPESTTTTTTSPAAMIQPLEVEVEAKATTGAELLVDAAPELGKTETKGTKMWLALAAVFVVLCAAIVTAYALWSQADAQESAQDTAFLTLQQLKENGQPRRRARRG